MSWQDQRFDFVPGVNIICGVSDKGKSAIIKAFELVRTNRPLGFEFASDWIKKKNKKGDFILTGNCIVTIGLTDGTEISRVIGKDVNEYRISTLKEPLKALNKEVPKQVSDLLNMNDINIQSQEDPYFLFNLSAPEIGRRLNQIASLSDIDKSFKNADSTIRSLNADIKLSEASIEQHTADEEELVWIEQADVDLKVVEKISNNLSTIRSKEMELRNIKTKIIDLQDQLDDIPDTVSMRSKLQEALGIKSEIDTKQNEFDYLENSENNIKEYNKELKQINKILKAKRLVNQAVKIKEQIDKLSAQIQPLEELENKAARLQNDLDRAIEEYNKANKEYQKLKPDTCPLCKRPGWEGYDHANKRYQI